MSKLKIEFIRIENVLVMRVLEQDEGLRAAPGTGIKEIHKLGSYVINSGDAPNGYGLAFRQYKHRN